MNKLLMLLITGAIFASCSILDTKEQTEIISERTCKRTCLMKNKTYQGYDEEIGCFCGIN